VNANYREDEAFINRLTAIVEASLNDEQFGVNQLALKMGLSRSQIHRKLKSICNKSVSQFIREARLKKSKEFLEQGNLTVSEIAYKVGFGSPSYFINNFHEYFGYPPGKFKNKEMEEEFKKNNTKKTSYKKLFLVLSLVLLIVIGSALITEKYFLSKEEAPLEKTILVLPLKSLTSDENKQYYADIISNSIRDYLTKLPGLKIKPFTTSQNFRESSLSSPEIARQANVKFIIDGYVRQQDDKVRVNIVLIDALKDSRLWGHEYNWERKDIFDIEDDIAKEVANSLQAIFSPEEIKLIEKSRPKNPEAYNNYQMGQYFCLNRDSVSIYKGIKYFEKAIDIDSDYAQAYAGLADGYYALSLAGLIKRSTGYDMAYKMAEEALDKDPNLSEAYAVLGSVSYFGYWRWEEARKFLEKAVEIDSNCMVAHLYYSSFLDIVGEPDKALKQVNKAIELEPFFAMPYVMKGIYYRNDKKYVESTNVYKRLLDMNPERWQTYNIIFLNFLDVKDETSAVETLLDIFSVRTGFQKYIDRITPVYETSGINGVLKLYRNAVLEQDKQDLQSLARLSALLDMQNEALDCLERRCRSGLGDVPRIIRRPEYENLHSEPRFQVLVDTMNLRPYFPKPPK